MKRGASASGKPRRRKPAKPRRTRHHLNVYVIELDGAVLNHARFRKHKAGIRANRYVQRYGLRLLPSLYAYANPMPYAAARDMEVELAIALQEEGYAVLQA